MDLFNEGVDLPAIDTVLMLRPTESKILFLQQLGRGLRTAEGKEKLVVLDFIGNHHSFLHKPQALFGKLAPASAISPTSRARPRRSGWTLPRGLLRQLRPRAHRLPQVPRTVAAIAQDYEALRGGMGRRPTLAEFYRAGANVQACGSNTAAGSRSSRRCAILSDG